MQLHIRWDYIFLSALCKIIPISGSPTILHCKQLARPPTTTSDLVQFPPALFVSPFLSLTLFFIVALPPPVSKNPATPSRRPNDRQTKEYIRARWISENLSIVVFFIPINSKLSEDDPAKTKLGMLFISSSRQAEDPFCPETSTPTSSF